MVNSADHDLPVLQNLSQTIEHVRVELPHFIQKQNSAVGQTGFAGPKCVRASTDQRTDRTGVVR